MLFLVVYEGSTHRCSIVSNWYRATHARSGLCTVFSVHGNIPQRVTSREDDTVEGRDYGMAISWDNYVVYVDEGSVQNNLYFVIIIETNSV